MYSRERIHVDELLRYPYRVSRVFAIFGKNWGPIERGEEKKKKGKEKNRYRRSFRGDSRLSRREPAIPETDLIFWISPALKRTTDGEKGRKSRESRVARVSSSPDFSAPPLRPGCGRIAYRG